MRITAAIALLLACGTILVHAQSGGLGGLGDSLVIGGSAPQQSVTARGDSAELKLLQIEQEADETLYREALLLIGRKAMTPSLDQ